MTQAEINQRIDRLLARLRDDPSAGQQLIDAFYRGNSEFEAEWHRQYAIANTTPKDWDAVIERNNAARGFGAADDNERVLPAD